MVGMISGRISIWHVQDQDPIFMVHCHNSCLNMNPLVRGNVMLDPSMAGWIFCQSLGSITD